MWRVRMELTTRDLQLDHLAGLASITWLWAGEEGRQGGRALEEGRGGEEGRGPTACTFAPLHWFNGQGFGFLNAF